MTMDEEVFELEEEFISELGLEKKDNEETRTLLVGTYFSTKDLHVCDEHLEELARLADTFGVSTVQKIPCSLKKIDASTFIHKGKLEELYQEVQRTHANLLIFDEEISPAQQRNLEKILKIPVMDRTELILEIFSQRAQTKEARLQVELARTKYQFPRLKRMWNHFSRQRAKGGFLKGEGEKQIEIDRRLLKRKVDRLKEELKEVERYRETQRNSRLRSGVPTFAIVGYTNAGKSTLLNALTEANVLVEDKLFATLDPTTRKFTLPNNQEVLLTDTVGFIRKLPHTLVAAFKSTLESTLHDDVLLHLIDASHPLAEEHAHTTFEILKELKVSDVAIITVLNKIDRCKDMKILDRLRILYPKTVAISALHGTGFEDLMQQMIQELRERRKILKLKIPQSEYVLVAELKRYGKILSEEYEENDVLIKAEIPVANVHRFDAYKNE